MDIKMYAHRTWAEVNLDHISHNVSEIRKRVGKNVEIMGVVKADGYGHGVFDTVQELIESGVSRLAVSMLDEAIQLRNQGIKIPILVLSYTNPIRAKDIIDYDISQTVFTHDLAEALSEEAVRQGKNVKIHIKLDTGMTRVGFMPGYQAVENVLKIGKLPNIIIEGLFTHLSVADEADDEYTFMQFERFMSIENELERVGIHIPIKHVANSAATLRFDFMHLDMVRPGIILYGLYPSDFVSELGVNLKPAMELKTGITLVKEVDEDVYVGYGKTFKTKRKSRLATIPVGYADGYLRSFSNKAEVLVKGHRAPIVGRVCMDQCMIDVTDIDEPIEVGDEVVLFGRQGDEFISVDELAAIDESINYELVCLIGKRVPRIYIKDGKEINVLNYLN